MAGNVYKTQKQYELVQNRKMSATYYQIFEVVVNLYHMNIRVLVILDDVRLGYDK